MRVVDREITHLLSMTEGCRYASAGHQSGS